MKNEKEMRGAQHNEGTMFARLAERQKNSVLLSNIACLLHRSAAWQRNQSSAFRCALNRPLAFLYFFLSFRRNMTHFFAPPISCRIFNRARSNKSSNWVVQ